MGENYAAFGGLPSRDLQGASSMKMTAIVGALLDGLAGAQAYLRSHGDTGPLPPPFNQSAQMLPAPRGVAGHARICENLIS